MENSTHKEEYCDFVDDRAMIFGNSSDMQNPFVRLVESHFRNEQNESILTYCLIEQTTLKDLEKVGEVYLFDSAEKTGKQRAHMLEHEKYVSLINDLKTKFGFLPSYFQEWYEQGLFLYIGSNHESNPPKKRQWCGPLGNDGAFVNQTLLKSGMDLKEVKNLLSRYCIQFRDEFFNSSPYYAILIKPVSVENDDSVEPLGNIYLHFGLKEYRGKDFFLDFLYKYLLIWFNDKAHVLIEGIQDRAKKDNTGTRRFHEDLMYKNILKANNKMLIRVQEYSVKYFVTNTHILQFEEAIGGMNVKVNEIFRLLSTSGGSGSLLRIDKFNVSKFSEESSWLIKFYQRRLITLIIHLFSNNPNKASLQTIHSYFVNNTQKIKRGTTVTMHLRHLSLLPTTERLFKQNLMYQKDLYDNSSVYEKTMLRKYVRSYIAFIEKNAPDQSSELLSGIYTSLRE